MWTKLRTTTYMQSLLIRRQNNRSKEIWKSINYSTLDDATPSSSSAALKNIIIDKIRINGPITVADFMKLAVSGYYSTTAASTDDSSFGIGHDFVTSPEISQMFGELIGVWCAYETWKMGHHGPWQMVELGPGNGSLMYDFLKTLDQLRLSRKNDQDHQLSVHLVELSRALAARQERLLCSTNRSESNPSIGENNESNLEEKFYKRNTTNFGSPIFWYQNLDDVPQEFSIILAHEFFDALPIHKFRRIENGKWREIYVDADLDRRRLKFALAPSETFAQRTYLTKDILDRLPSDIDHVEISPESLYILRRSIERITKNGGAILIIDYGSEKYGDTLRAFRRHRLIENFLDEEPGSYDITADVNFEFLKRYARDQVCCFGPIQQGEFLKNLGIEIRLKNLLKKAKSDEERNYLRKSYEMLVNDDQMGSKFKVMAMFPKVLKPYLALRPPVGFSILE